MYILLLCVECPSGGMLACLVFCIFILYASLSIPSLPGVCCPFQAVYIQLCIVRMRKRVWVPLCVCVCMLLDSLWDKILGFKNTLIIIILVLFLIVCVFRFNYFLY